MNIIIYFKLIIYFFSPKFGIFQFQNQMNRQYLFGSLEKNANAIPWNHLFHVSSLSTTSNVTADVWECMVHTRDTPKLSFFLVVYIESIIRNSHCKKIQPILLILWCIWTKLRIENKIYKRKEILEIYFHSFHMNIYLWLIFIQIHWSTTWNVAIVLWNNGKYALLPHFFFQFAILIRVGFAKKKQNSIQFR